MNPLLWPRWAQGLVLIAVGILVWQAWLYFHDKGVIEDHEAEVTAEVSETTLEAERTANRNDEGRRVIREIHTRELVQAREDAIHESPDETDAVAGPAVRAVLRELRTQADQDSGPAS